MARRLCVFYRSAKMRLSAVDFVGQDVDWIVCQECQRLLRRGERLKVGWDESDEALTALYNIHGTLRAWVEELKASPEDLPITLKVLAEAGDVLRKAGRLP